MSVGKSITIRELQFVSGKRNEVWDPNNLIDASYRGNELGGEVGEAQNIIKKLERERLGLRGSRIGLQHLAEELADVVICAVNVANHYDMDLSSAIVQKFNHSSTKNGFDVFLGRENYEELKRFDMGFHGQHGEDAFMESVPDGEYVLYSDVVDLLRKS